MSAFIRWSAVLLFPYALGCGVSGDLESPGSPTSIHTCTLAGCSSGAAYFGDLPLHGSRPTALEVTRCINGSCETAPVVFSETTVGGADCSTKTRFRCAITPSSDPTTASVWLQVLAPAGTDPLVSLQDGDTYEVTIGVHGEVPLLRLTATAGYKISHPNGFDCAPVCKYVPLAPTA